MAHATLPADVFFESERRRLQTPISLSEPSRNGGNDTVSWYFRAIIPSEEQELLLSDGFGDSDYDDGAVVRLQMTMTSQVSCQM